MTRRTFAGAAAVSAGAFQKTPLTIAFLGASHSHAAPKIDVVRASADWRIAGASESDPKVREAIANKGIPLLTRVQVLEDPAIRVVAVESGVRDHAADALAALRAGKHVHLEKPPAHDLAGFRKILDAADRGKRLVQVGYMWRHHPGFHTIFEIVRGGWLGESRFIRGNIGTLTPAAERAAIGTYPGGIMFELGCHLIDPVVRLMGRPRRVSPFLRNDGASDGARDNTAVVFEWDRAMAVIQSSMLQYGAFRQRAFEVHGSNGSAVLQPIEPPSLTVELAKAAGPYKAGPQKIPLTAYERYVDDFIELAAGIRGERKLAVSPAEDLAVQETLLRAGGMA